MKKEELEKLNDQERRAFKKLKDVPGATHGWRCAIQLVTEKGNAERFRKMIAELNEAIEANPESMTRMLGAAAFDAVVSLQQETV